MEEQLEEQPKKQPEEQPEEHLEEQPDETKRQPDRKKRNRLIVFGACAAAVLICAGYLFFSCTLADGHLIARDAATVAINSGRLRSASSLLRLDGPESIDLCGCDVSTDIVDALTAKFPACSIRWDVPLHDNKYPSDTTELTLPDATEADVAMLKRFPELRYVDASGSTCYDALLSAQAELPDCTFVWTVEIGGVTAANTDESLLLSETASVDEIAGAIDALPLLTQVDLRQTDVSVDDAATLAAAYPAIQFQWMIPVLGENYESGDTTLDLSGQNISDIDALTQQLLCFPGLTSVDLTETNLTEEQIVGMSQSLPGVELIHMVTFCDQEVLSTETELNANEYQLTSPEEIMPALSQFSRLEQVDLCNCGLSNEQMETLMDAYPDVKFVWVIHMGTHSLRTDAVGFSTLNPSKAYSATSTPAYIEAVKTCVRLTDEDIQVLRYSTDLEALDLGHNEISDLSVLANLTNLKILILADNWISDLSPLAELTNLQYLELFMNRITDLSPLSGLSNLLDLNICSNKIEDLGPLYGMTSLERLWYSRNKYDRATAKALAETLPNCECNYTTFDETGDGWREHPRYTWMRAYFGK